MRELFITVCHSMSTLALADCIILAAKVYDFCNLHTINEEELESWYTDVDTYLFKSIKTA